MKKVLVEKLPETWVRKLKRTLGPLFVLQNKVEVAREFAIDRQRYLRFMLPDDRIPHKKLRGKNLEAQLTKDYHRVEKGLALRNPKNPFGSQVCERLDDLIPLAEPDSDVVKYATTARAALERWNDGYGITQYVSPTRDDERSIIFDPQQFFASRRSVRDFEDRRIPDDVLSEATRMAINTPSVCNRQGWHVRYFSGADAREVLSFQNGNRGFADQVPTVAVVSVDMRLFAAAGERNQPWIEGGLFSMTLVWALHALGIDTCMLNMSVNNGVTRKVRKYCGMHDAESVIMMIAIGYGRSGHRRARSPRRALGEVWVQSS